MEEFCSPAMIESRGGDEKDEEKRPSRGAGLAGTRVDERGGREEKR